MLNIRQHAIPKPDYLSDPARLEALHRLNIIDSGNEEVFEAITRFAASVFDVELATIHLVDDERQWVKASSNGLCAPDTPVGKTFCELAVAQRDLMLVPDLLKDPRFHTSEFVTGPSKLRFYAGMPLMTEDGFAVGTLCLLDTRANVFESFSDRYLRLYHQLTNIVICTMELRQNHLKAQRQFLQAAEEDGVTGLLNSRGVLASLHEQLSRDDVTEKLAGMLEIRLTGLERIRRAYGTGVSNQLLQQIVERMQNIAQPSDMLARISDSSFLVARVSSALTEETAREAIMRWADEHAQKLLGLFETPFVGEEEPFYLLAHLGMAFSTSSEPTSYAVLERAGEAAFRAEKESPGASSMCWSDPGMKEEYRRGVTVEGRLRRAVEEKQLTLVFQPIVDLNADNKIVGAEALVRWPQLAGPPIGPDFFVPLAEELGLIGRMGLWVFEKACETLRLWHETSGQELWMSVNISPKQLHDPSLASQLETITLKAGIKPSQVKLEITESALVERFDKVTQLLRKLITSGFKLALDDFGTGHSSLSRLVHLPFNVLKVDRAFVSDSPDGPGAAVVASLAGLAESLKLETIGEGVETEAQESFLRQHGYRFAQGYRYAKPLTAEDFLDELAKQGNV